MHSYTPRGVCSRQIDVEVNGDTVESVQFTGGCDGNLKAISKLVALHLLRRPDGARSARGPG